MIKVFLSAAAASYILSERSYLEASNPRAADATVGRLRAAFRRIGVYPQIGVADTALPGRRLYVAGAYVISYRVEPDMVQILSIRHGRQQELELDHDDPIDDPE